MSIFNQIRGYKQKENIPNTLSRQNSSFQLPLVAETFLVALADVRPSDPQMAHVQPLSAKRLTQCLTRGHLTKLCHAGCPTPQANMS